MKPLRVLITNISLSGRSGTETVVRDLALGLVRQGHLPIVYSPILSVPGQKGVAEEIREALIPVTDDLRTIAEPPDIIHGNHLHETMTACFRFPEIPAIWLCHSWDGPHDKAPNFPNIMRFLAVDESCLERLRCEEGVPRGKSELLLNCVDLERFKPRPPLPIKAKKALVLSHYAANSLWLEQVREACLRSELELDAVGAGLGKISDAPEELMLKYDIVFAVDRTAMEATAVGNAVILCGQPGLGPMVKTEICADLHKQNFGRKWLNQPVTVENVMARISEYNADESRAASEVTRTSADSKRYFEHITVVYEQAIAEFNRLPQSQDMAKRSLSCASDYLTSLSAAVRTHIWGNDEYIQTKIQRDGLRETAERRRIRLERIEAEKHAATIEKDQIQNNMTQLQALFDEHKILHAQIEEKLRTELRSSQETVARMQEELNSSNVKSRTTKQRVLSLLGLKR